MVPTLPPEIIDRIIGFAREGLYDAFAPAAACALVCENWLPAARRELYRCLDVAGKEFLDSVGFAYLPMRRIMGTSHFAPLVTEAENLPFGYAESAEQQMKRLNAEQCPTFSQLLVVAVQCTNLRTLRLRNMPASTLNWLVSTCARPPIPFPSLRHLSLASTVHAISARVQIPTDELPVGISSFLAAIPILKAVSLEGFGIATDLVLPTTCARFSVELPFTDVNHFKVLSLKKACRFLTRAVSLQTIPATSHLRKLSLKYFDVVSAEARAIESLLSDCTPLKDLRLVGRTVGIVSWSSPSDRGRLQKLDVTRTLPIDIESLAAIHTAADFVAEGIPPYLQDVNRSGRLRALEMRLEGHWNEEAICDVCAERRILLNGKAVRESE